jgi:hypothetical protein
VVKKQKKILLASSYMTSLAPEDLDDGNKENINHLQKAPSFVYQSAENIGSLKFKSRREIEATLSASKGRNLLQQSSSTPL